MLAPAFPAQRLADVEALNQTVVLIVPFVFLQISRYPYLLFQSAEGTSPSEALPHDIPFIIDTIAYGLMSLWLVYGEGGDFVAMK